MKSTQDQVGEVNVNRDSSLGSNSPLTGNNEVIERSSLGKVTSNSLTSKTSQTDTILSSTCSSALYGFEKPARAPLTRVARLLKWNKPKDKDQAVAEFKDVVFQVTKLNKRMKKQERTFHLSAYGIDNIRPSGKASSRERWRDILICYKIDELTLAIKYTNKERIYRAKSKEDAEKMFNSLREGVNAYQKLWRKQLQKKMVDGDEKERDEPIPILRVDNSKHANEDQIRKIVEQILLSKNSKIFKLKQSICGFAVTEIKRVKELRNYLDQFKYKILEQCRPNFLAKMDMREPDVYKCTLEVIESVIESACLPSHIDEIYKILGRESKSPDYLIWKLQLLSKKSQNFYGIDRNLKSKDNWLNAVVELVDFPKKVLPSAKMQCLLNTAKHIHDEAKRNYRKDITGDDLLPIVIFVLVKASWRLKKVIITAADQLFIETLINPDTLQGEGGYYLCVFGAALEFIRNYDRHQLEERFKTINRLKDFGFF